ncbi:MAG: hypothetical protein ACO3G4_08835 [Opitutaceae bacterium]
MKPLVYLFLGVPGSGRREILADLLTDGLAAEDTPAVLLPAEEPETAADAGLPRPARWRWDEGTIAAECPPGTSHLFILAAGRRNPVDQLEAFKAWFALHRLELTRVICVLHGQLAARQPALLPWYDACVHFADVVLLHRREGLENKWLSGFLRHFEEQRLPCILELVKAGRVRNPALILEPQARRVSQAFDPEPEWIFTNAEGEEVDPEEEPVDDDEELTATPAEDPYFERRNGGRRVREIPDVAAILDADAAGPAAGR